MAFITGSTYDNYWVSHHIPRSDLQYSWITASILRPPQEHLGNNYPLGSPYPDRAETYGHAPADGMVSSSVEGVVPAYNFLSASEFVAYDIGSDAGWVFGRPGHTRQGDSDQIATDFAGMNTIVDEPLTSSENFLGFTAMSAGYGHTGQFAYINYLNKDVLDGFMGYLGHAGNTDPGDSNRGIDEVLNAILLNRNGPYQYPSWKQVRTGEHPVARYHRRNNTLSIQDIPVPISPTVVAMRSDKFTHYNEPAVVGKFMPLSLTIGPAAVAEGAGRRLAGPGAREIVEGAGGAMAIFESPLEERYKYTYGNFINYFADNQLNNRLGLTRAGGTIYERFYDMYSGDDPGANFSKLEYKETIYPREKNAFLSRTRNRTSFDYVRWVSTRESRKAANQSNSMSKLIPSQSVWPLDARDDFTTAAVPTKAAMMLLTPGTGSGEGELQNKYTIFHSGSSLAYPIISTKSVRFSTRAFLTASSNHSSTTLARDYSMSSSISLWFKTPYVHTGMPYGYASASLIVKGIRNVEPAYEIRFHSRGVTANVGLTRGYYFEDLPWQYSGSSDIGSGDYTHTTTTERELSYGIGGSPENLADDDWHHVVLAWEPHTASLYVDGIKRAAGRPGRSASTASYPVVFGAQPGAGTATDPADRGWNGNIDDITFFSGTLSDDQVTFLYNSGTPLDVSAVTWSNPSLLVYAHYSMGEHANDGTVGSDGATISGLDRMNGYIQNTTVYLPETISNTTGNLSASVTSPSTTVGFQYPGYGIVADAPFNAEVGANTNVYAPVYARPTPERDPDGRELGYWAGDTLWEAAAQSGKYPFYDSYGYYKEQIRGLTKDYTVVPEFRISEHIPFYVDERGANFLATNAGWMQLTGAAEDKNSSSDDDFYKTYSHTDFMKYFNAIKSEHDIEGHRVTNLTLSCQAILRFLPYEGFYPAVRSLQLANLFSSSYSEHLLFKSDAASMMGGSFGNDVTFKTFLTPLFAPGVFYNSIKSGIAVDHPIMTSSFDRYGEVITELTSSYCISSSFGYRVPFEALVRPEDHLGGVTIVDYEVHPSASINSTASWNGAGLETYKMAMNNFVSEVPKFFLHNEGVTSVVSARDDNGGYYKAAAGREYRMRVVLRNGKVSRKNELLRRVPLDSSGEQAIGTTGSVFTEPEVTMYSRRSAFGPPVYANHIAHNESYEPFTPPYMDGYADVELIFRPTETKYYLVDDIVSQITSSFFRIGEQYFDSYPTSVARKEQMHITSSVNILDVVRVKAITYAADTGLPVTVADEVDAPGVAVIQTKWETPILDFSEVSVTMPTYGTGSVAKGMWHQYGTEPLGTKGIFLEIQSPSEDEKITPALTSSLADLMGFPTSQVKLGKVALEKTIREAVVAIPFVMVGGVKEKIDLSREIVNNALKIINVGRSADSIAGDSVVGMLRAMKKYVFPPKLDFLKYRSVQPYAMYIFEFEHVLSKEDLGDIWQNLSPNIGRRFEAKTATIDHQLLPSELLSSTHLGNSLRWMVFKVKQKASSNYYQMLKESIEEEGYDYDFMRRGRTAEAIASIDVSRQKNIVIDSEPHDYTYNWPYDYFSLIEMVKMDAAVNITAGLGAPGFTDDATLDAELDGVIEGESTDRSVEGEDVDFDIGDEIF
ncbi:hypothetical protein CMI37_16900 [Candidatus Pacearchaeota archaeon]|nr:hypothetical protein [Candidatus Pacearchaeota archaeon]